MIYTVKEIFGEMKSALLDDNGSLRQWIWQFFDETSLTIKHDVYLDDTEALNVVSRHFFIWVREVNHPEQKDLSLVIQSENFFKNQIVEGHLPTNAFRLFAAHCVADALMRDELVKKLFNLKLTQMRDVSKNVNAAWVNYLVSVYPKIGYYDFIYLLIYPHPQFPAKSSFYAKKIKDNSKISSTPSSRINSYAELLEYLRECHTDAFLETDSISVAL